MGYQECWVVSRSKSDFRSMVLAYMRVKSQGLYENFTCNAQPLSIVCLKHPIAGVSNKLPVMWTCGERSASNVNGVFGKELPWHCRLKFIPIEAVVQNQADLFQGIDFESKKPSSNQYLTRYEIDTYAEKLLNKAEKER